MNLSLSNIIKFLSLHKHCFDSSIFTLKIFFIHNFDKIMKIRISLFDKGNFF